MTNEKGKDSTKGRIAVEEEEWLRKSGDGRVERKG